MPIDSSATDPVDSAAIALPPASASVRLGTAARAVLEARRDAQARKQHQSQSSETSDSAQDLLRQQLLAAVSTHDLTHLRQAIASGMELNFFALHEGRFWSPLALACRKGWEEGVRELVQAGACESRSLSWWASHNDVAHHDNLDHLERPSTYVSQRSIFKLLLDSEPREEKRVRQALAQRAFSMSWFFEIIHYEAAASLSRESCIALELQVFLAQIEEPQRAQLLGSYWRQCPQVLAQQHACRLRFILERDSLESLEALSATGYFDDLLQVRCNLYMTDIEKMIEVNRSREDFFKAFHCEQHSFVPFAQAQRVISPYSGKAENSYEEAVPLWVGAIILQATNCLKAMGQLPELMHDTMSRPHRRAWLALCPFANTLREAQRQGADLRLCTTDNGDTPLHLACAARASRTRILDFAKLCPQWIDMRDAQGRTPLQRIPAQARELLDADLVSTLEKLSLSIALGVRNEQGKLIRKSKDKTPAAPTAASSSSSPSSIAADPSPTPRPKTRRL